MFEFTGVQQGWQCPICKRVYAPFMPCCSYCGEEGRTKTSTTTEPISEKINSGSSNLDPDFSTGGLMLH